MSTQSGQVGNNSIGVAFTGAGKIVAPYLTSAANSENPFNGAVNGVVGVVTIKGTYNSAKTAWGEVKTAYETIKKLDNKSAKKILDSLKKNGVEETEITPNRFLDNTLIEKKVSNNIKAKDKSTLEVIEKLNPDAATKIKNNEIAHKTTAKLTAFGIGVSTLCQIPELIKAAEKGELSEQVGKSAIKIAGNNIIGAATSVIAEGILKKYGLGKVGAMIGSAIGYTAGDIATTSLNEAIFD